ncbi:MAG: hypothetical protein M1337_05200, partial [Actinobacteria bacterium]|nr:hypothetical protein [Actinomycetota bacterium]
CGCPSTEGGAREPQVGSAGNSLQAEDHHRYNETEVGSEMKKLIFGVVAAGMLAVGGLGYTATQSLAPAPAQAVTQAAPAPVLAAPLVGTESATATDVSEPKEAVDTDNVQEQVGDQNAPDVPGQAEEAETAAAPGASK